MNVLFYSYSDSSDKELLVTINTIGYSKENLKTHTGVPSPPLTCLPIPFPAFPSLSSLSISPSLRSGAP